MYIYKIKLEEKPHLNLQKYFKLCLIMQTIWEAWGLKYEHRPKDLLFSINFVSVLLLNRLLTDSKHLIGFMRGRHFE